MQGTQEAASLMQGGFLKPDFHFPIFVKKTATGFAFVLLFVFWGQNFEPHPDPVGVEASRKALEAFKQEQRCLGATLWYEARGEPPEALGGVLSVVEARADASGLSICEVIAQPHQFSWYAPTKVKPLDVERQNLVKRAHKNRKLERRTLWFFSGQRPVWAKNMTCRLIGKHLHFCAERKK